MIGLGVILVGLAVILYLVSRANYPLFHSIVDMATVFIAGSVFLVVWNGRRRLDNNYYLIPFHYAIRSGIMRGAHEIEAE